MCPKEEEWEQGMWIERATVGELSTRPLGANPEPPSTTALSFGAWELGLGRFYGPGRLAKSGEPTKCQFLQK
jgi:hypothetical protein